VERGHRGSVAGTAAITVVAGAQFHFRIAIPARLGNHVAPNINQVPVLW
jgi:hypothetical protein